MALTTEKRNVLVGVTGSVAAYKSAELVRTFITRGYSVKVAMTEAAQKFVGEATFSSLTSSSVLKDMWSEDAVTGIAHVKYAQWADAIVIAPASANTIARIASGIADDMLSALVLATEAPVVIAPAMNSNMYENPRTQANIATLKSQGVVFVGPEEGMLACGMLGRGRMSEPWDIFYAVRKVLSPHDLEGQRIVITTGLTRDSMDVIREVTQISSTKLGVEIAREAYRRGAEVVLIHSGKRPKVPEDIECIEANYNEDLKNSILHAISDKSSKNNTTMLIMAGLANQYRIKNEKSGVSFEAHVDVLDEIAEIRGINKAPLVITFVAGRGEKEELFQKARHLIQTTSMDILVGKFAEGPADFESNELWMIDNSGRETQISSTYRSRVATQLFDVANKVL